MNKVIVITGGTAGIGRQSALGLLRLGHTVVVTGRDQARGEAACAELRQEAGAGTVELAVGDLATRAGLRALAEDLLRRFPRIDVLVNNAGAFAETLTRTADGVEQCFAVNVAAPWLLAHALLPALEAARPSRVVNLTGGTVSSKLDVENLEAEKGFTGLSTYDHSKRAADAMSLALAKELAPRGVFVNVVYPGQASTGMTRSVRAEHLPVLMRPFFPLFRFFVRDDGGKGARKASRSTVWAATAPELEGVSGRYFDTNCKPGTLHASVLDEAAQRAVVARIGR